MKKTVLVTGGAGFIGSNFVYLLLDERPEAMEAGDFILAGISTTELLQATDMAIKMKRDGVIGKPCPDYTDESVSMKVVRIIQGYVNVVNRFVWRKENG